MKTKIFKKLDAALYKMGTITIGGVIFVGCALVAESTFKWVKEELK